MSVLLFILSWGFFKATLCVHGSRVSQTLRVYTGCVCLLSCFSCVWLFVTLWTVTCQDPLSMGFSRQEYGSELPCLPPGDIPDPGIKPATPTLQADSWPLKAMGETLIQAYLISRCFEGAVLLFCFVFTNWRFSASLLTPFFSKAIAHFVSPGHVLVIHIIFQMFSFSLSLLWWSVISNLWCYYCNCVGIF